MKVFSGSRLNLSLAAGSWTVLLLLYCLCNSFAQAWPAHCALRGDTLRPVPAAASGTFTLATQNLWRLFDDVDDGEGEVVATPRYRQHLDKLARQVTEVLREPAVLAVQEAENQGVLADLANAVRARRADAVYRPVLLEGHDRGGIDVGYLVRGDWQILHVEQVLAQRRLGRAWLFDRPPLLLRVRTPQGETLELLNVHLRSLLGSDTPGAEARRVAGKRARQARLLADWLRTYLTAQPQGRLVLLGDFNAAPEVLGGVDVLGMLRGAGMHSLLDRLPAAERYTYVHDCRGEALDNVLVSPALLPRVQALAASRGNAGVPARFGEAGGTALRSSDHDGLELYLLPLRR